jgi:hypothetical protein
LQPSAGTADCPPPAIFEEDAFAGAIADPLDIRSEGIHHWEHREATGWLGAGGRLNRNKSNGNKTGNQRCFENTDVAKSFVHRSYSPKSIITLGFNGALIKINALVPSQNVGYYEL